MSHNEPEELLEFHNNVTRESTEDAGHQIEMPQNQGSHESEGDSRESSKSLSAGTSRSGRVRIMSRKMADSVSQRDFYRNAHIHYMASQAALDSMDEDLFHDAHLDLQERMDNPVAFHAKMMGDIMYLHQALQQKDASEFVNAVVQEINGHVENTTGHLSGGTLCLIMHRLYHLSGPCNASVI